MLDVGEAAGGSCRTWAYRTVLITW
jgi:hypothetical protein